MQIPVIKTQRLSLRLPMETDWSEYEALMTSKRALYMGGPHTRASAWGLFCHDVAQWSLMGHGALMIEERDSGICVGQVGINHGPLFPERELGWFVYRQSEGKGYAFEAATALLNWAFSTRKFDTLVSYIDPENARSRALAQRLGASVDSAAPRPESTTLVYRHPVPNQVS